MTLSEISRSKDIAGLIVKFQSSLEGITGFWTFSIGGKNPKTQ
jgi:hypothetical protein